MPSANSVLVAVDFSQCSEAAFRRAVRIAAWKHRTRVTDGGVPVEYPVQEPSPQIAAQRFRTVPELEGAVRQILRVLQILRPT